MNAAQPSRAPSPGHHVKHSYDLFEYSYYSLLFQLLRHSLTTPFWRGIANTSRELDPVTLSEAILHFVMNPVVPIVTYRASEYYPFFPDLVTPLDHSLLAAKTFTVQVGDEYHWRLL